MNRYLTRAHRILGAWWMGVRDGWAFPHDLGAGWTWKDDPARNEAYDRGANLGQRVRSPRHHQRRKP